jgi:Glyoxalase-like domain
MAVARFKDLCLDAGDPARLGAFWASVLGRTWEVQDGAGLLTGPTPQHTIWVNRVPEAKTVKHRVHLDIYARDQADLQATSATIVEPRHGTRPWTVMADPEGGEFCAFPAGNPGRAAARPRGGQRRPASAGPVVGWRLRDRRHRE